MTNTTTPATDLPPGQATCRYLRALQDRKAGPIDWDAAPPRFQRYPPAGRVILPWTPPPGSAPADPQLALLGTLLRQLLGLRPNTRHALPEAAAALLPVGDPLAGIPQLGDRWYRIQQIEAGLVIHRAILAGTARGLAARIHSDGTNQATDAALGLPTTSLRSLSFLLLGHHRPGPVLRGHDVEQRPHSW